MATRHHLGTGTLALLALGFACVPGHTHAQIHKVAAPEKVTRAIGVYEWTGELTRPTAARLIPISLFIDSHMEDAGVYLARPVPFALGTGDVYSIERAGQPEGTLNLAYARNIVTRHSATDENPVAAWYAYGTFLTVKEEAKLSNLKPSAKTPVIVGGLDNPDDEQPHFVYRAPSATSTTTPAGAGGNGSASPAAAPSPAPDDDPDRPTLRHRDPVDQTKQKKSKDGGYVSPPNSSLNDDPDRPRMRRGVPEGQVATAQLSGLPPDLHQAVAVSDAANRDAHPFARQWASSRERADTLDGIEQLAQPRVANYLLLNKLTPAALAIAPAPVPAPRPSATPRRTAKPTAPAPPPPPVPLANEQLNGYTLSYGGLPTFLYTAEAAVDKGGPVYITLVVQRLPAGELQVALSSVTDAAHLDRTPWMRPIDVVDPDWSHRASLLFELRAQTSRQFALYRLVSAKAEQTFITGIIE
jgi:hypothetical protein